MSDAFVRHFFRAFRQNLNPTRIVVISFAAIILTGALLLSMPIASHSGQSQGFLTALFTATSATCVTGLVVVDTWATWTLFGQVVILAMIQMGGLGFMTVITLVSFALRRRIGLSERLLMVSTLNLNDMDGVVRVVRHALIGTFSMEAAGAVILSLRFIPQFGLLKGVWRGIFHAVSAFCNAGFDLMGSQGPYSSLSKYSGDPVVLITVAVLIAIGGLGFFVWEDVVIHRRWKALSFYSKMVIGITVTLILGGAAFIFFVEYNNPATLGNLPLWEKIINSLFQSITLRTAGFNTIDQASLRDSSMVMCIVFMFIGGSSGSTAGGIKTVTAGILILAVRAGFRGSDEVTIRGRAISARKVMDAMTLAMTAAIMLIGSAMVISLVESVSYLRSAFEVASAMGTVGLTTGITTSLSSFSRVLIICLMYLGRVGMLSFSFAFMTNKISSGKIKHPTFNIMIG